MSADTLVDDFTAHAAAMTDVGPPWLAPVRRAAMTRFEQLGYPTTRNEDWHYTSPAAIADGGFQLVPGASHSVSARDLAPYRFGHDEWPTLVFVNGRYDAQRSNVSALPAGVRVLDLETAFRDDAAFLEGRLTKVASFDEHTFTALNTAFMHDGAVIHVAQGTTVERPIHLLFVAAAGMEGGVVHPRVIVAAERNAKVAIIESWVAIGATRYFSNTVTEVDVAEGATVTHVKVQRESADAFHVGTVQVAQARDSHFVSFSFASGALLSRTNVYTHLNGAGCGSTLNGLYLADGAQKVDHQTQIEHVAPNCYSRELYKGVLDGEGHGVFNGKVYVHPEAQKTDGKQENHTLLLSDRATIDTKPQLEIFADDVKCTHGATVGRLDEMSRFYMRSRGVGDALTQRLLVYAFCADVLEKIEIDAVREGLEALVLDRFTGASAS